VTAAASSKIAVGLNSAPVPVGTRGDAATTRHSQRRSSLAETSSRFRLSAQIMPMASIMLGMNRICDVVPTARHWVSVSVREESRCFPLVQQRNRIGAQAGFPFPVISIPSAPAFEPAPVVSYPEDETVPSPSLTPCSRSHASNSSPVTAAAVTASRSSGYFRP
jgi:hypothetical protein